MNPTSGELRKFPLIHCVPEFHRETLLGETELSHINSHSFVAQMSEEGMCHSKEDELPRTYLPYSYYKCDYNTYLLF